MTRKVRCKNCEYFKLSSHSKIEDQIRFATCLFNLKIENADFSWYSDKNGSPSAIIEKPKYCYSVNENNDCKNFSIKSKDTEVFND